MSVLSTVHGLGRPQVSLCRAATTPFSLSVFVCHHRIWHLAAELIVSLSATQVHLARCPMRDTQVAIKIIDLENTPNLVRADAALGGNEVT
jgi:hypothetical protein